MKTWAIDYSVRMINGETEEKRMVISARHIDDALLKTRMELRRLEINAPDITEISLWGICIIVDDENDPEEVF